MDPHLLRKLNAGRGASGKQQSLLTDLADGRNRLVMKGARSLANWAGGGSKRLSVPASQPWWGGG